MMAKARIVVIIVVASGDVIVDSMVMVSIGAVAPSIARRRPMTAAVEVPVLSLVPMSVAAVLFASANVSIVILPMPIGSCMCAFVFTRVAMSIALALHVMLTLAQFMSRSMTLIRE